MATQFQFSRKTECSHFGMKPPPQPSKNLGIITLSYIYPGA